MAALLTQSQPGQRAMAVVRGTAVNQDGRSSGLTAPNGPSQTKLLLRALRQAGGAAGMPQFVAVHGTGTPLGDPIEMGALGQVGGSRGNSYGNGDRASAQPVVLGSVKSCYGHTEGAAGLTGLLMAAMATSQQCSAPVLHLRSINPYVEAALADWCKSGPWAAAVPRQQQAAQQAAQLAGTSSFGMSGVNAHALVSASAEGAVTSTGAAFSGQLPQRQRLWPLPPMHPLLHLGAAVQQRAVLSCTLWRPHLAYLRQYSLGGEATLPAAAVLELMAASGAMVNDGKAMAAVAAATLGMPVTSAGGIVLTCTVELGHSTVQVVADSRSTADAHLAPLVPAAHSASSGGTNCASLAVAAALRCSRQWLASKQQSSVAVVAAPTFDAQVASDYCCHPSISEAAMHLGRLSSAACTLSACSLYVAAASSAGEVSAAATSSTAAVLAAGSHAAVQVEGITSHTAPAVEVRSASGGPQVSPAWQLMWQPVDLQTGSAPLPCSITALVISTQPWPLSHVCTDPGTFSTGQAMVAANAVWGGTDAAPVGSSNQPIPELCFSTEAHLQLLLQTAQPQQCLFVQPPGQAVNTPAALAAFRAIAGSQASTRLSLVTYDQQDFGALGARPQSDAGLLLGKLCGDHGSSRVSENAHPMSIAKRSYHMLLPLLPTTIRHGTHNVHGAAFQVRGNH